MQMEDRIEYTMNLKIKNEVYTFHISFQEISIPYVLKFKISMCKYEIYGKILLMFCIFDRRQGTEILPDKDQDMNDLDKCLRVLSRRLSTDSKKVLNEIYIFRSVIYLIW